MTTGLTDAHTCTHVVMKRVYMWSFSKDIVTLNELLNKSRTSLFQKMHSPSHCLNPFLPSKKIITLQSEKQRQ